MNRISPLLNETLEERAARVTADAAAADINLRHPTTWACAALAVLATVAICALAQ